MKIELPHSGKFPRSGMHSAGSNPPGVYFCEKTWLGGLKMNQYQDVFLHWLGLVVVLENAEESPLQLSDIWIVLIRHILHYH